jgi:hypothetical protein
MKPWVVIQLALLLIRVYLCSSVVSLLFLLILLVLCVLCGYLLLILSAFICVYLRFHFVFLGVLGVLGGSIIV